MVELGHDAGQVADAVAVGVGVGAGVDLVEDAAVPPAVRGRSSGRLAPWGIPSGSWRAVAGERIDTRRRLRARPRYSCRAATAMICCSRARENGSPTPVKVTWWPKRPFTVSSWVTVRLMVVPCVVIGTLKE